MITTLSRSISPRFDVAPTEAQMRLAIAQVLSMPFAYRRK
ncbi:hypothetical protein PLAN_MP20034 [Planktothrix rubescens CCAP 1459/22]|jgi:hypothetical protein|uniref:Uncharacterized protein n=1 Tax=Planktothrix rubescens CCAP 1459/22 TaxID=329571 RepID=A0A6J7ZEH0_PLARU|nr:hypothetical protein PLAN_MP20034 [Planktothrix rubescens NIVA-CYA 18]